MSEFSSPSTVRDRLTTPVDGVLDLSGQDLNRVPRASQVGSSNPVEFLVLDDNTLERLDNVFTYRQLSKLSVKRNKLTRMFQVGKLVHLHTLILTNNQITSIEGIRELRCLVELDLSHNHIRLVDGLGPNNATLKHLDLSHNAIPSVGDLTHIKNLKTLKLNDNELDDLRWAEHCLCGGQLETLTVHGNKIEDLGELSHLAHLNSLATLTVYDNPMISPSAGYDRRPYVINWCLQLRSLDNQPVSVKESLMAEWMFSQSKGHLFGPGQHEQITSYLISVCPDVGSDQGWQAEAKLNAVLAKAVQHQTNLTVTSGVAHDKNQMAPLNRRRSWQPFKRSNVAPKSSNNTPRLCRRSVCQEGTRSGSPSTRTRHETFNARPTNEGHLGPTVKQVTDRLYKTGRRQTMPSKAADNSDASSMSTSCYQLPLPPTLYPQLPKASDGSGISTSFHQDHLMHSKPAPTDEVALSDDVEDEAQSSRLASTEGNASKATTDDGYECSASSDEVVEEADDESTSVTYNRMTKSALPLRIIDSSRQARPRPVSGASDSSRLMPKTTHRSLGRSPPSASLRNVATAVASSVNTTSNSGPSNRAAKIQHVFATPRREMRCSSTYDSLTNDPRRMSTNRSSRIACYSTPPRRQCTADTGDQERGVKNYVASKYSTMPSVESVSDVVAEPIGGQLSTTFTDSSPVSVVHRDIVIDSLRAQLSAAQSALALERHLRQVQAEKLDELKRRTNQEMMEKPLIDLGIEESEIGSQTNVSMSQDVSTLKADRTGPTVSAEISDLRHKCQELQAQMNELQVQVGQIIFSRVSGRTSELGQRSGAHADMLSQFPDVANNHNGQGRKQVGPILDTDDTQLDFSSMSTFADDFERVAADRDEATIVTMI